MVRAVRETQVPVVLPGDIEFIGANEPLRIAIGSSDHGCQKVARLDALPPMSMAAVARRPVA